MKNKMNATSSTGLLQGESSFSYDQQQTTKNFFYDGLGRVKSEQNPYFDSFSTALSTESSTAAYTNYTYDTLDRVTNVTFPDYTNITVVFNHWNISTFDQNVHQKDYILDAYDRITEVREYNIDTMLNDGVIYIYNTTYGYDDADQLIEIVDAYGNNFSFTYDSLGRRTRLQDPDIGEWNYTYDITGNLVSQAGGGGNLITGDGFFREYNNLNQLIRIRNGSSVSGAVVEEYYYDPYGERIKIWRNDSAQTVVYTPFRELMQIRNTSGIFNYNYIYDGSVLVAKLNPDGTKHYYHPDHLGSTTLITDSTGSIVEETFYEPFGDVTSGGSSEVKLYTGQFSDSATGQYYFGARYYKPAWGRFVQADPEIPDIYNPQSLNRYSYSLNNPYKYVDPDGKEPVQSEALKSGSAESIIKFVENIQNNNKDLTSNQILTKVANAYTFDNPSKNNKDSSNFASNFIYTEKYGVVDMRHFFVSALVTQKTRSKVLTLSLSTGWELLQCAGLGTQSCFTYEDPGSNRLGRDFGFDFNSEEEFLEQLETFMEDAETTDFPDWVWDEMPLKEGNSYVNPFTKMKITAGGKALPRRGITSYFKAVGCFATGKAKCHD
jgi:RHS repeat-associated protein